MSGTLIYEFGKNLGFEFIFKTDLSLQIHLASTSVSGEPRVAGTAPGPLAVRIVFKTSLDRKDLNVKNVDVNAN